MGKGPHKAREGRIKTRVKTARGRKMSSTRWLQRQLNDPYVARAQEEGWRSRAVFKLMEIDDRFSLFKRGQRVLDLGCAPGSWLQLVAQRTGANKGANKSEAFVMGIDMIEMETLAGCTFMQMDFMSPDAPQKLQEILGAQKLDVILSDMAANVTGHRQTDHLRTTALAEAAAAFALEWLREGGHFCAKTFQGGTDKELLTRLKQNFTKVLHVKPKASRKESVELYVLALGFRAPAQRAENAQKG